MPISGTMPRLIAHAHRLRKLMKGTSPSARPQGWTDWYRFAGDQLGYAHEERVEYANLRYVEEQNRDTIRRGWGGTATSGRAPKRVG